MTRTARVERLRVDPPAVPVDDAFVAVLAAHAAASRPTTPPHRVRSRLAVVLVAAAVAATTLSAAWTARELAARPPAPATHERRVEPAPDPVPSPAHTRRATVEENSGDPAPTAARGTGRHHHRLLTPTTRGVPSAAPTPPSTRSVRPPGPSARRTQEADRPRENAEDRTEDRAGDDRTRDRDPSGPDDSTDDSTDERPVNGEDGGERAGGERVDDPSDDTSDDTSDDGDGSEGADDSGTSGAALVG